jgi:AcrR family transcriptional regulator
MNRTVRFAAKSELRQLRKGGWRGENGASVERAKRAMIAGRGEGMQEMGNPAEGQVTLEGRPGAEEFPLDGAKRRQILEGARRVFLQDGFDGASIGDIVRAAGVSKGTLYAYFPSKERLFEALVFENYRKQAEALYLLDTDDLDARRTLFKLGVSFLEMLTKPEAIAFLRIVIGASAKFPEIGRAFYKAGPAYGFERLGGHLARLTEENILAVDDAELAAQQFLALCKTTLPLCMLLGEFNAPPRSEIERHVESAVDVFMAAYGAKT